MQPNCSFTNHLGGFIPEEIWVEVLGYMDEKFILRSGMLISKGIHKLILEHKEWSEKIASMLLEEIQLGLHILCLEKQSMVESFFVTMMEKVKALLESHYLNGVTSSSESEPNLVRPTTLYERKLQAQRLFEIHQQEFPTVLSYQRKNYLENVEVSVNSFLELIVDKNHLIDIKNSFDSSGVLKENVDLEGKLNQSLTDLRLQYGHIGKEIELIRGLKNLTALNIANNRITSEEVKIISEVNSLTSLVLCDNLIDDEGVKALISLTKLKYLELSDNVITSKGLKYIAQLKELTSLGLAENFIGSKSSYSLKEAKMINYLSSRHARHDLPFPHIGRPLFGNEGLKVLCESLTNLQSLNIRCNPIGFEGACLLSGMTWLQSLNVHYIGIGDEGCRLLLKTFGEKLHFPNGSWFLQLSEENLGDFHFKSHEDILISRMLKKRF